MSPSSVSPPSFNFDGVLGLALDQMSQSAEFNLMDRLVRGSSLQKPLFSVFLSDSDAEESEITFGDYKRSRMASELFWVPVSRPSGYWQVQIQDITLNNRKLNLCKDCQVVLVFAGWGNRSRGMRRLVLLCEVKSLRRLVQLNYVSASKFKSSERLPSTRARRSWRGPRISSRICARSST